MSTHLQRLAHRVQSDPFFLAAPLARYAESQQLDDDALTVRIGCDRDTLRRLRLCRNPEPMAPDFWHDVQRIAARFHLDADRLAEIVRFGQALLHAQLPTSASGEPTADGGAGGSLLAAREETEAQAPPGEES